MKISVVIPTFNRQALIGRAIGSALRQEPGVEVIVVDNASTDGTAAEVARYPSVAYVPLPENHGAGPARNAGIHRAAGDWVVCLDDDDTLSPDAFQTIRGRLRRGPNLAAYPVIQFRTASAHLRDDFTVFGVQDYLSGRVNGDFTAVIHRTRFVENRLSYPCSLVGAESRLWYEVADRWGIPTFSDRIVDVHSDAAGRCCSIEAQIRNAAAHAEAQEEEMRVFGHLMEGPYRRCRLRALLGAAAYSLLAGDRRRSRDHSGRAVRDFGSVAAAGLYALAYLPPQVATALFRTYRSRQLA